VVWLLSLRGIKPDAMDDWGLLRVLPIAFFVAVALLLASIGFALTAHRLATVRLGLHVVALVLVLHGTVPLIFPATNYPWAYKHMGVVGYVNLRGRVDSTVDIYQNWPGFFAAGAWFDKVAGVASPLSYAKWAPVYFNLLFCVELRFVYRWLPMRPRERWLAVFVFVAGNWVGQDYFAPQALALVLSLAVFGLVLMWFPVDRRPAPFRWAGQVANRAVRARPDPCPPAACGPSVLEQSAWSRLAAFVILFTVFSVVVVTHQLSPYLVVSGVALITIAGFVRPRWLIIGLAAVTLGYLVPHMAFLRSSHNLTGSPLNPRDVLNALGNPFDNLQSSGFGGQPLPGRVITALAAPGLILGMGLLALAGALRRLRAGRAALLLVLLAASPVLLAFGQNYGGEAIFRVYLFSLPWLAALAASALAPASGRGYRLWVGRTVVVATLMCIVLFFMSAFYGSVELYRVRSGAVAASQYFYDHAAPGSGLGLVAPNFPSRLGANYDQFRGGSTPPPLTNLATFQSHLLGPADVESISQLYQDHIAASSGGLYLCLSADQETYAEVLGLMPEGSVASLDRALATSPRWQVTYRNRDAVIYRFLPAAPAPR
jgi:hypothetical protein